MSANFQVGGSVSADSPFYVKRQADDDIYLGLKNAELCYVFNSRQMGKSSLLVNVKSRLQKEGYRCCFIDISRIGSVDVTSEQFYGGLVSELWRGFKLPPGKAVMQWWSSLGNLPAPQKLGRLLSDKLIEEFPNENLVVFIDEIDSVQSLGFIADDLFSVIRSCFNLRAEDSRLCHLNFAFFGVALPSDLINESTRSPFNIGRAIKLEGFRLNEARSLAKGLPEQVEHRDSMLERILHWTRGQPFLTQKMCSLMAMMTQNMVINGEDMTQFNANESVDKLVLGQLTNWESNDNPEHLRTILNRILLDDDFGTLILEQYMQVLEAGDKGANISDLGDYNRLYLTGLIAVNHGLVTVRTRIYEMIFDHNWAQQQLNNQRPYSDKLRQWAKSTPLDDQFLLSGHELNEANKWAADKHLPEVDHRYLAASRELENHRTQQWNLRLQAEIDQRKQTEQELQRVMAELEQTQFEAVAANQAKSEFLARVSQEVRTHINSVLGLSYVAQQQEFSENSPDYFRKIHRAANYMLGVVNDIVDIDRVEQGKLELNQETFYLDDVLDKLIDVFGMSIYEKGLYLSLNMPATILPTLVGDPARLEQLLSNLIANAVKYTDTGAITLAVSVKALESTHETHPQKTQINFIVSDTGLGINEQSYKGVVSRELSSVIPPGIGLSICCELAQLMGGELWVDSQQGVGSAFSFSANFDVSDKHWLPSDKTHNIAAAVGTQYKGIYAQLALINQPVRPINLFDTQLPDLSGFDILLVDEQGLKHQSILLELMNAFPHLTLMPVLSHGVRLPHWLGVIGVQQRIDYPLSLVRLDRVFNGNPNEHAEIEQVDDVSGAGLSILVAEDDEINQQIVAQLLRKLDFDIDTVSNGVDAVEAVKKKFYHLVLMDIEMPKLCGVDAVKQIRALGKEPNHTHLKMLPIIAMTAHALIDDRKKFLAVGMNDHVGKPLDPVLLIGVIQQWLNIEPTPVENFAEREQGDKTNTFSLLGVDTLAGLRRCSDNQELYLKILEQFAIKYQHGVSFEGHDIQSIKAICHGVRGSAANLGAVDVSQLAAEIEMTCRRGATPDVQLLEYFSIKLVSVSDAIFKLLNRIEKEKNSVAADQKEMSLARVTALLKDFIEALDSDHDRASQIIASIRVNNDSTLMEIENMMAVFETDKARELSLHWIEKHQ